MKTPLPKTVLWDMDGTLIDQSAPIIRCYTEVITAMGYPEPSPDEIRRSMGGTMASTMSHFVEPARTEEAGAAFRKRFPEIMLDGLLILPGALELIAFFAARHIPQAIFTNKYGATAREVSDHCGFSRHIPACIGHMDTTWSKPSPQLTHYVLAQIKATTQDAVLIGDSPTDAETAQQAGIRFYGVSTGAHSVDELKAAGAELACQSLEELHKKLS
ncbi:MAG: HAD family hydrolase [Opitutales bacterium]